MRCGLFWPLTLTIVAIASGCGPSTPRGEVAGTATLDGVVLTGVQIQFLPDPDKETRGPRATALSSAQGSYELTGDDAKPGA